MPIRIVGLRSQSFDGHQSFSKLPLVDVTKATCKQKVPELAVISWSSDILQHDRLGKTPTLEDQLGEESLSAECELIVR